MICPFCDREMKSGTIHFDGRARMRWFADDESKSRSDRFWDSLGGVGELTGAEYNWAGDGKFKSDYCPSCKKMVFETDILK